MKKISLSKKLTLNKETITALNNNELDTAKGGGGGWPKDRRSWGNCYNHTMGECLSQTCWCPRRA